MNLCWTILILASLVVCALGAARPGSERKRILTHSNVVSDGTKDLLDIRMPFASPEVEDAYYCSAQVTHFNEEVYITQFEPLGTSADTVHHMLIYSCPEGANQKPMWDCGHHGVCPNSKILYAWAKNAPPAYLPDGVGFRIPKGGTIVLQLHYARALGKEGIKDNSGIRLHLTREKPKYLGGIYLMVAGQNIQIPPHKENVTADVNCFTKADQPIYVFGFRTHAHALGTVITGYKYFPNQGKYELFAKGSPQWPQAFYPLNPPYPIMPKDVIAARCVYNSTLKNAYTGVGMTHNDEMCNLYMMFYTDINRGDDFYECLDDELQLPPLPVSSLLPPPKNAALEDYATGKMGHSGNSMKAPVEALHQMKKQPTRLEGSFSKLTVPVKYGLAKAETPAVAGQPAVAVAETSSEESSTYRPEEYPLPAVSLRQYYASPVYDSLMNLADNEVEKGSWKDLPPEAREFHSLPGWPLLEPGLKLGQVAAVSMTEGGTLVIFHRGDRVWDATTFDRTARLRRPQDGPIKMDTVLYLNPDDGSLIGSWGKNTFYMPHGLTVDHEDNVWLTDVGLHQVFKYSQAGKKMIELGTHMEPGSDDKHFCKPTSVAVDPKTSNFFVADGYCNSRIMKFNPDGSKLLLQVGQAGNALMGMFSSWTHRPGPFDFSVPHALTMDSDRNLLFAADRENGRIQAFTTGNVSYVGTIVSPRFGGRLFSVAYTPAFGGLLFAVNGDNGNNNPVQGYVVNPRAKTKREIVGAIFGSDELTEPHDILVTDDANEVYVAETNPPKLWKFARGNLAQLHKSLQAGRRIVEKPQAGVLTPQKDTPSSPSSSSSTGDGSTPNAEPSRALPVTEQKPISITGDQHQQSSTSESASAGSSRLSWPLEVFLVAAVPLTVLGLILGVLRLRKRSNLRTLYNSYKHTGPDKYGFGGILGGRRGKGATGGKDGFERLDTTGSDGEDDLFVSSSMRPGGPGGKGLVAGGRRGLDFSLDDDESSSDSDAEVFSQAPTTNGVRVAKA